MTSGSTGTANRHGEFSVSFFRRPSSEALCPIAGERGEDLADWLTTHYAHAMPTMNPDTSSCSVGIAMRFLESRLGIESSSTSTEGVGSTSIAPIGEKGLSESVGSAP